MAIFGSIIKSLIDIKDSFTTEGDANTEQLDVLKSLLDKAKDTAFGKHYKFAEILKAEDVEKKFAQRVPYFDYNKIDKEWWHLYHEGISHNWCTRLYQLRTPPPLRAVLRCLHLNKIHFPHFL